MKEYAKTFYKSQAWKNCRAAYFWKAGGLCEQCLSRGLYVPGEIVHHKTEITPANITDPRVTLNFDNLELLCRSCHAEMHGGRPKRYEVDPITGRVSAIW